MLAAAIEPARRRARRAGSPAIKQQQLGPRKGPGPGLGRSGPGRMWKARIATEARPQEASAPPPSG
jgi:hypothetical protein